MDSKNADFSSAKALAAAPYERDSIGRLGEKVLHNTLKYYYSLDPAYHEVRIGRFCADICRPDGIWEIQTASFYPLQRKLERFLQLGPVTVVYPIAALKWIVWIDPQTGEVTPRHKSPKKARAQEAFSQLYWIRSLVGNPNFRLTVVSLEWEERRLKNGWSEDGKRGSVCSDRIPISLLDEQSFSCAADYLALLPPELLDEPFTVSDLRRSWKSTQRVAQRAAVVLCSLGAAERIGKRGREYLYQVVEKHGGMC